MSNWSSLPFEILRIIFANLKSDEYRGISINLAQCALTCNGWKDAAHSIYFSEMYLDSLEKLYRIKSLFEADSILKQLVKKLEVEFSLKDDNASVMITIDALFSHLEDFETWHADFDYGFFQKMLIEDQKFIHLRNIPKPLDESQSKVYSECLMFIKDRIISIDLFLSKADEDFSDLIFYEKLRENVSRFSNLEKFKVWDANDESLNCITDFLELFCENNSVSDINYTFVIDGNSSECYSTRNINNDAIQPAASVKKLRLDIMHYNDAFPIATDEFMIYIMRKFPRLESFHLDNLKYTGYQCDFPLFFDHITQSPIIIDQFLKYLVKINSFFVGYMINSNISTEKLIKDLLFPTTTLIPYISIKICYYEIEEEEVLQKMTFIDIDKISFKNCKIIIKFNDRDECEALQSKFNLDGETIRILRHNE